MIATAQLPAQAPHLLASSTLPYPSDMSAHPMLAPPSRQTHRPQLSHPIISPNEGSATGRGFKGLFSRNRVASPEPDPTLRSRLRSFIGENKAGLSRQTPISTPGRKSRSGRSRAEESSAPSREPTQRVLSRGGERHSSRPGSPEQTKRMAVRFGPSLLPAIQKGDDGKWQPPSLSRGSLSTSALALYADGDDGEEPPTATVKEDKKSLAVMFNTKGRNEDSREKAIRSPPPSARAPAPPSKAQSRLDTVSRSTSKHSLNSPSTPRKTTCSHEPIIKPTRKGIASPTCPPPPSQSSAKPATSVPSSPTTASARPSGTFRSGASTPQTPVAQLSSDHYHLRLATSYLIRVLMPFIRGSGFAGNEKMLEMKRKADEHVSALARMEKGWGGEWTKASRSVGENDGMEGPASAAIESKVRAVSVSERAKERERKIWVDVMRDGILLCLLLNQLFPSSPQHIARVNITEDGILRATNLTRFQTACQTVGLPEAHIFGLADVQEGSESGMGRVAGTVIALARLAGRSKAAVKSSSPATPSPTKSPAQNRVPSRAGATTPASASPTDPRAASPRPTTPVSIMVTHDGLPNHADQLNRPGAVEMANDLHAKLAIDTSATGTRPAGDDSAYHTPNTSVFVDSAEGSPRRAPLPRSTTHANISPSARPTSPPPSASPSRSGTPVARPLVSSGRPTLRPRYTTGSRVSVSFAPGSDLPLSPRNVSSDRSSASGIGYGGLSGERTPSLISSASRVTSGYTRSSAAFSVSTVVGDEHAVDFADDDPDNSMRMRMRERRMSEKTLHNARQKILGTLLSSDDLPEDLRRALEKEASGTSDDPRDQAITQSLAALEGWKTPTSPHRTVVDVSPRRIPSRPVSRCGDVMRVAEEDEVSSAGGSAMSGSRVSLVRRTSANGKVYVPRRAESPAQRDSSTSPSRRTAFPAPNRAEEASTPTSPTSSLIIPKRPSSRVERRQSDGISYANARPSGEDRPVMSARNNSMVNLGAVGASSSIFRESLLRASQSQPLQILEVNEPGFPPVRYQVGNCVGRGQFGAVYRSLNLSTGQMVAIKRIKLDGIKLEEVNDVMQEVELLKKLAHPSIVRYEGMSRDDEYLNIVLEYIENGSLVQTLKSFGRFNEQLISSYVAKILEGLDYLHSQGVVHCDLKAANILSTKNGNVKLSDFGVSLMTKAVENLQTDAAASKSKGESKGDKRKSKETVQGSPNWMAPEVINLQGATTASDIWSLGCTIVELLTGQPPYSDLPNSMAVLWHIVMDTEPPIPASIGGDLRDFLELCFIKDPEQRPAAVVLFEHPWIKKLNPDLAMRPQDSVPFLRRVSMDLRRVDSTRLFSSDQSGVLGSRAPSYADISEASKRNRYSLASSHGREASDGLTRDHELIKTTFGKAILCRICHASVKKGGVLCQHCGLICHTHCVPKASTRCDVTEQLALLARQQEYLAQHPHLGLSAASSRRPSFNDDGARDSGPLTALPVKILAGLKRNKSTRVPATDLSDQRRCRSSSNVGKSFPNRISLERPSLDVSGRSADSHSRASVFTDGSLGTSESNEDPRRRSAIRFELNDPEFRRVDTGEVEDVKAKVKVDEGLDVVMMRKGKGYKRDNKSDCVVM